MSVPADTDTAAGGQAGRSDDVAGGGQDRAAQERAPWLAIDWREHQRWVTVEGRPVNVIELGPGDVGAGGARQAAAEQTLVFVHGLSGSWQNWLEQLPVLAAEHRVVALDLPGFGHSPMPEGEISIAGYARILDALMGELGIEAAAVVGNSMGGFIGAELAIAFPARVERLVLVSAAGLSTHNEPRTVRAMPALRRLNRVLAMSAATVASRSDAVVRRPRLRAAALDLVVAHPTRVPAALAAEQVRGAGKPGFLQALEAVIDYDVRDRLPEIACPTLIVWGARDRLISVRDADVFEELIPDARKVVYEDTGHMAMLERPAQFNGLLEDFLHE
ncbi:MAG TPA: alpha/beta fold hydrolase [Solirubrobacteraceae bacterium]